MCIAGARVVGPLGGQPERFIARSLSIVACNRIIDRPRLCSFIVRKNIDTAFERRPTIRGSQALPFLVRVQRRRRHGGGYRFGAMWHHAERPHPQRNPPGMDARKPIGW